MTSVVEFFKLGSIGSRFLLSSKGQKSAKEKVHILEDLKTPKNHSEINVPLDKYVFDCH